MRWTRRLRRCAAALALAGGQAGAALAQQPAALACPPAATMPSPEQVQAAAREASDRGMLWRLRKDGRTSYLYGTIHVGRLAWAFPGPAVSAAFADADTLALELDMTDPAVGRQVTAPGGPPAPALPEPLRERLHRQLAAACIDPAAVAALHPVMQAVSVAVLASRWEGLDPTYAQEVVLAGRARALQRGVVSLETVQSQLAALIPDDPQVALRLVDETLQQLEANKVRPVIVRLARAWERGDLAELEGYERWCDCADTDEERAFMRRLNDGRNPALAERIDALHGGGKRVFAAIGALHMTGPQALPRLMAERGYVVERVAFGR
jgi:uncharacterized protein YbaP (TraB family)